MGLLPRSQVKIHRLDPRPIPMGFTVREVSWTAEYRANRCLAGALVAIAQPLNAWPPLGEYFLSVLSKPRAARGARTVPSIRIAFALTLRP